MLRRGIEPIIATVILVAVALVIAVAVVGYLMGLFGGLAGGQPQIAITSIAARKTGGGLQFELYVNNAGAGSDKLLRVEVIHGGTSKIYYFQNLQTLTGTSSGTATLTNNPGNAIMIGGNYRGWLTLTITGTHDAAPGDTVILKLYFERSGVQTINVVVSP